MAVQALIQVQVRIHQPVLRRSLEEDVQQVHVPGTVYHQDPVVRPGIDPLDVPEDPQVAVEPPA